MCRTDPVPSDTGMVVVVEAAMVGIVVVLDMVAADQVELTQHLLEQTHSIPQQVLQFLHIGI